MSNTTTLSFTDALNAFLAKVDAASAIAQQSMSIPNYFQKVTLEEGHKFIRVVKSHGGSRHVYCFIEKATGNILKASGWRSPAKGSRGSIYNPASYENCDVYGSFLYRR